MAKGFSIGDLISAIQFAVIEAQEVAEEQHMRQLAEYFDGEGNPITIPLMLPNPSPEAGEKDEDDNEIPLMVEVGVPKITLVPQNSMTISEMTVEMEVPIGNLEVSDDNDPDTDDEEAAKAKAAGEADNDPATPVGKFGSRLARRRSKRHAITGEVRNLRVSGGSFFGGGSKRTAKIMIKFEGGDPPEVIARIEQALVKHVDT